jgi:arabinogalactan oligomer / maltooligosaccharide transport system permease protein
MRALSRRGQLVRQGLLLLVALFVLAPIWVLFLMATDGSTTGYPETFHLWPQQFTLDRFADALRSDFVDSGFAGLVWNSLVVAGRAALISVAFGATMAYAFARLRFPGNRVGLVAILLGAFLPPIALGLPLFVLAITIDKNVPDTILHAIGFPDGVRDSTLTLTLLYATFTLPLTIWLMRAAFRAVPADLEASAFVDGASRFTAFRRITLPLAMPSILVAALVSFLLAYSEFALAWLFIESEKNATLAMVLAMETTGFYTANWGLTAAYGLLMAIPVVIVFVVLQRFLLRGALAGALDD